MAWRRRGDRGSTSRPTARRRVHRGGPPGWRVGSGSTRTASPASTTRRRSRAPPCARPPSRAPPPPVSFDGNRLVTLTDVPPTDPADQLYELWCNDDFVA